MSEAGDEESRASKAFRAPQMNGPGGEESRAPKAIRAASAIDSIDSSVLSPEAERGKDRQAVERLLLREIVVRDHALDVRGVEDVQDVHVDVEDPELEDPPPVHAEVELGED